MTGPLDIRVWDYETQEMIYGPLGIDPVGVPYRIPPGAEGSEGFDYFPNSETLRHVGLTDQDGTAIFELDLVQLRNPNVAALVVLHEGSYGVAFEDRFVPLRGLMSGTRVGVKVIGNRFEQEQEAL